MAPTRLLPMIPLAYLVGSIPFGLIVGLAKGVDPRTAGSGNIGATNVGRLLGGKFFALVFTLDLLKGMLPVLAAGLLLLHAAPDALTYLLWLLIAFAAIMGHMFSIFLKFKGGKGVATSAGVALGLFPYFTLAALAALVVWLIFFSVWRYVSLASIVAAIAFPIAYLAIGLLWQPPWPVFSQQLPLLLFACFVCIMIIVRHRTNITRLLAGTEHRIAKHP